MHALLKEASDYTLDDLSSQFANRVKGGPEIEEEPTYQVNEQKAQDAKIGNAIGGGIGGATLGGFTGLAASPLTGGASIPAGIIGGGALGAYSGYKNTQNELEKSRRVADHNNEMYRKQKELQDMSDDDLINKMVEKSDDPDDLHATADLLDENPSNPYSDYASTFREGAESM